jgi:hypothetical protein
MDDYGARGYEPQKRGMDEFAARRGIALLSLHTCQELMLKAGSRREARG